MNEPTLNVARLGALILADLASQTIEAPQNAE